MFPVCDATILQVAETRQGATSGLLFRHYVICQQVLWILSSKYMMRLLIILWAAGTMG